MILASLILAAATETPEILGVRCQRVGSAATIRVLATAPVGQVTSERNGDAVVFLIPATVTLEALPMPEPIAPIRSLALESGPGLTRLRVSTAPNTRVESRADGSLLTFSFQSLGTDEVPSTRGDVEQLYPLLFPQAGEVASPPSPPASAESEPASSEQGLRLGPLSIQPALVIRYVDAQATFLDAPTPVRARYLEVQPQLKLATSSEVLGGRVRVAYQPSLRLGDKGIPILSHPSHFLSASFDRQIGSSASFSLSDQYGRGTIETQVLDPGREYFYNLGPFERNQAGFSLSTQSGERLAFVLNGSVAKENVAPGAGYFDNERQGLGAAASCELRPTVKLSLSYQFERVPPPAERLVVEMRAHSVLIGLDGELTPTLRANLSAGYRRQGNPRAAVGGDRYDGVVVAANLNHALLNGATLGLGASRSTQLSAFESNAFYIADTVQVQMGWPLPLAFQVTGGLAYQWNDYRLAASGLDEPRHDRLLGWSMGLGRVLTRWSSLRADYSADRRRSNVHGLSTRTHSLIVQLTLGATGGR